MKLLVCGGRDYSDRERLKLAMNQAVVGVTEVVVIHGGARGADTLAGEIAKAAGVPTQVFLADWDRFGKRAGFLRNTKMLEEGKPDIVLAAPGGAGTRMMIEIAKRAGVTVIEIEHS